MMYNVCRKVCMIEHIFIRVFNLCILVIVTYAIFLNLLIEREPLKVGPPIRAEELGLYQPN